MAPWHPQARSHTGANTSACPRDVCPAHTTAHCRPHTVAQHTHTSCLCEGLRTLGLPRSLNSCTLRGLPIASPPPRPMPTTGPRAGRRGMTLGTECAEGLLGAADRGGGGYGSGRKGPGPTPNTNHKHPAGRHEASMSMHTAPAHLKARPSQLALDQSTGVSHRCGTGVGRGGEGRWVEGWWVEWGHLTTGLKTHQHTHAQTRPRKMADSAAPPTLSSSNNERGIGTPPKKV